MTGATGGPPRRARALAEWLLPSRDAAALTGDLDEEYLGYIRPERGRLRADVWYWRQVLLSLPRLWRVRLLGSGLRLDVRYAMRRLARRPAFTLAAVSTLGLALGLTLSVHAVVDAVLLRPLPFHHAERLVRPIPDELFFVNSAEAAALSERMTTLQSSAAWSRTLFLLDVGRPEEVRGASVSWNHFDMLGAEPLLGRTFVREDAERGDALILAHGLWVRGFGADRRVVGRAVQVSGQARVVVGVMGPDHVPMEHDWEAWSPMSLDPAEMAGQGLVVNGRLRDGVTLEQSRDELRRVLGDVWAEGGDEITAADRAGMEMITLGEWLLGDLRTPLFALGAGVLFLLLLACGNVANLFLAQTGGRMHEIAVRTAIGASRLRVARQLALEVMLVSFAGAALGYLGARGSLAWLVARLPADIPRAGQIQLSGGSVAFLVVCALVAAALVGSVPLLRAAGLPAGGRLAGARGGGSDRRQHRLRSGLVVLETALAVVLLSGAGLMVRSLLSLHAVDTGFDPTGIVTFRPSPPSDRYPAGGPLEQYYDELNAELERLPGVLAVGGIQFLPMTPGGWWTGVRTDETRDAPESAITYTAMRVVREGYFRTMGIQLVEGRALGADDFNDDAPARALANQTFVLENGVRVGGLLYVDGTELELVGVVRDVHQSDLRTSSHAELYVPYSQRPWRRMHMVVRLDPTVPLAVEAVRAAADRVDPDIAILGPRLMSDVVGTTLGRTRLVTTLLALFGFVGVVLGGVGVYGVAAQAVAERRREMGIRLALGAAGRAVVLRTVGLGLVPVVLGVGAGVGAALSLGTLIEGLLFEVGAADPVALAGAPLVLVLVALVALSPPALRAGRVDPAVTLREE